MFPTEFCFFFLFFLKGVKKEANVFTCFFFLFQPPVSWMWTRGHTLEVPILKPDFHSWSARRQGPTHVASLASLAATAFYSRSALSGTWDGVVARFVPPLSDTSEKRHFSEEPTRVSWQYGQLSEWEKEKQIDWLFPLLFCIYFPHLQMHNGSKQSKLKMKTQYKKTTEEITHSKFSINFFFFLSAKGVAKAQRWWMRFHQTTIDVHV